MAGGALASRVTNVEVMYQDGQTLARIDIDGTVRFSHQTEIAKDGKPFRVIVDILSATHHLGAKNFWALPLCPVKGLRTSQYSVKPEKVVRLVFDLHRESIYQVTSDAKSVTLSFPFAKGKEFSTWSSTEVVAQLMASRKEDKAVIASKPAPTTKSDSKAKSVGQMNAAIDQDRMTSLQGAGVSTPPARPKSTMAAAPKVTKPDTIAMDIPIRPELEPMADPAPKPSTPLVFASAVNQPKAKASPPKKTTPTTNKTKVEKKVPWAPSPAKPVVVAKVDPPKKTKPAVKAKSEPVKKVAKPPSPAKPVVVAKADPPKKTTPTTNKAKVEKPVVANTTTVNKTKSEPAKKATPSQVKKVTPSPAPAKPVVVAKADPPKKTTPTASKTEVEKKAPSAPQPSVAETSKKKPTSRFRRSPTRPTKIKGTLVAEFPKRLVIKYKPRGRDPFETLINETRTYDGPVGQRVPNVEGLRLVGVIESDGNSNSALFEDKDGYGYILKEGDKVRRGYVLRVDPEEVHFQIFEYGWSRTFSLSLDEY